VSDSSENDKDNLGAWFLQEDTCAEFPRFGEGQWTVLWEQQRSDDATTGRFCAFARPSQRDRVLSRPGWDLLIGDHLPGFTVWYEGDDQRVEYQRAGDDEGFEPLVRIRNFHGIRPGNIELSEDFRLFHNLWTGGDGKYFIIEDDGTESLVAEVNPTLVRVRTRPLRRYQAARQLDLLLFVESDRWSERLPTGAAEHREVFTTDSMRSELFVGETSIGGRFLCRYIGKRVIPAPPIAACGRWPFENPDEHFPEFIIGSDKDGAPVRFSCNPDELSNYFGANPGAPHYLTPVFFRRDVLQKYYDQPERYSVDDGNLRCASLWSLRMDNDHPDHVMVFLGDLGRDLPIRERDYWLAFCMPEGGELSDTVVRRAFLGEFAAAASPDIVFRHLYERFAEAWRAVFGWDLLRPPNKDDEHILQRIRLPLTESLPELEGQLLNIVRLLVDFLNDAELKTRISADTTDMKSIAKVDAWLREQGYPNTDRDVAFLRSLQSIRSKGAAHRKGSDFDEVLAKVVGSVTRKEAVSTLIQRGIIMLRDLGDFFALGLDS
jgi:hypothetical protein